MIRDIAIFANPVTVPGVCIKCRSQNKEWFIDLGCDTEFNIGEDGATQRWTDGAIYICCACYNSMVADTLRKFPNFLQDHDVRTMPHGHFVGTVAEDDGSIDPDEQSVVGAERLPDSDGGELTEFNLGVSA